MRRKLLNVSPFFMKLLFILFSLVGYYLIYKGKQVLTYILFGIQNIIIFFVIQQPYAFVNTLFCFIFLIQILKKNFKGYEITN